MRKQFFMDSHKQGEGEGKQKAPLSSSQGF